MMQYNSQQCMFIFKEKYQTDVADCYAANVFYSKEGHDYVLQGFVINKHWFVDGTSGEISEIERFYLINNVETDVS